MEFLEKLNKIFRQVFNDDEINIKPEMTANDVDGWDSLSYINLIVAIENGFNIAFSRKEVMSFNRVADLMKCIERKITAS
ncbi:MAG: acyl carrier protein [Candidatus Omnitrophota bacterium]